LRSVPTSSMRVESSSTSQTVAPISSSANFEDLSPSGRCRDGFLARTSGVSSGDCRRQ
jgi:hypothetical protein